MVAVEHIEQADQLDPVSDRLQRAVLSVLRPQWLRDLLHGVWLGHPLHPVMVQVPVGAWISAAVLDAVPGQERAATTLIATGAIAAVPTAMAGANDWASMSVEQRRVGLLHAASNTTALALYTGSLIARLRGRHGLGKVLGYTALGVAGAGAYLGGHLSYRQGGGVNHAVPALHMIDEGWHPLGTTDDFIEGEAAVRHVDDVPVLVYRQDGRYTVLLERCGHLSGPLGDGEITEIGGERCVVCPWHGSTFKLVDGGVVHGPAATNQPALQVRVVDGTVQARRP